MTRGGFLCKFCALIIIHMEAVVKSQTRNEHDVPMPAGSQQQNAFYALRSCHQVLHGDRGEFFSPDYLCSNPALWCNWTIQVQPGKRVQIYLEDMTPAHVCHLKTDQIHLDESPVSVGQNRLLERCWRSSVYTSTSNTVHVVQLIRSNPYLPHRGFYGLYQAFGLPGTSDLNEVKTKEEQVKDPSMEITKQKSILNDLEENVEREGVSQSINPPLNEVLPVTTGSFRESRRIRGEAKNQKVPFQEAFEEEDVEEVLSAPTGKPNLVTVEEYTPMMFDDEPHDTLAPTSSTLSISTSSGTTVTQSTKKRSPKRKQVLMQSPSATTANARKNEVPNSPPTEPTMAEPPTRLVEDVGPVSMDTDGVHSKKIEQPHRIKGKSLPVQTFRLATEPPLFSEDCSRTSVPTLLYAVCFLLCFLIALLLVGLAVMYRRSHHGTFLPHCRCSSSSFTDNDINNNRNSGSAEGGSTSRSLPPPPPPPPLHLPGGPHDLPLLRFSPLNTSDGCEGKKTQKENEAL